MFFRLTFLKNIYFSSCKIPENQESASRMVTNKVMSYTDYTMTPCIQKVFIATYTKCICIWSTMYYLIFGNKGKLVAWTLHRFYVLKLTHPLLYDDDTISHAANDIKRIFLIVESKILDGRSWSFLDIELCTISTLKRYNHYT